MSKKPRTKQKPPQLCNKENKLHVLDASHLFSLHDTNTPIPYSHEYELYLDFLKQIACATIQFEVNNIPKCWVPFILYFDHKIGDTKEVWDCDKMTWESYYNGFQDKRRAVEIASECRPELVHALYLSDTDWLCPRRQHLNHKEFIVTGNGSFHRPEVQQYQRSLQAFTKPYPSEMHCRVSELFEDDARFHLIIATGVLGLVPEELFNVMPEYDSGLPNQLRVTQTVAWYFQKWKYNQVIVYSDFYAEAISQGLVGLPLCLDYVFGHHYRVGYENLLKPEHLARLESVLCKRQNIQESP